MALPFVPLDQIQDALDIMTSERPSDLPVNDLLLQFETYSHRTRMNGNYPLIIWNCHMNFDLRATNHVEGLHRLFNEKVKVADPNIYVLIKALKGGEQTNRNRMREIENGHRLHAHAKKLS